MYNIPKVFMICFIATFIVYSSFGLYILYKNPKGNINRVFFALCVALSIWAFGFSLAISAANGESSLIWRRIAAVGRGSTYAILLHFILILIGKINFLAHKWVKPLIYFPALIMVYVFAISTELTTLRYNLSNTSLGWINNVTHDFWDRFFYAYYISYILIALVLVWKWGRDCSENRIKKQSKLIIVSFAIAFILGTATDVLGVYLFSAQIPQMAPIIIMIPIVSLYYSVRKHGLIDVTNVHKYEPLLNESNRVRFYNYLLVLFIAGAVLNFITEYLLTDNSDLGLVIKNSVLVLSFGFLIRVIQTTKMTEEKKDIFSICILSLSIPIIIFKYIEMGAVTSWAFPFLFIIISITFSKIKELFIVSVVTLLTQIFVWINNPIVIVEISSADYFGRVAMLSITILFAFHINKIFIKRLQKNSEQIDSQKLISEISHDFVTSDQFNFNSKVDKLLKMCGEFYGVDRASICIFNTGTHNVKYNYEWCNKGIETHSTETHNIENEFLKYKMNKIINNEVINIPDFELLSKEMKSQDKIITVDIKSLLAIPVVGKGLPVGAICFESVNEMKSWRDDEIDYLKIVSNIFVDALNRVDVEKEISKMAYHDQLTKLPNRLLFNEKINKVISLSNQTGKMIGVAFLDLDSFKSVNDTLGHDAGDELLIAVAGKLSQSVDESNIVARFGGDEFLVMLGDMSNYNEIIDQVSNIMYALSEPLLVKGQEFFITTSVGIAIYPLDGYDSETLIKNADIAMYRAKEKGKNQYVMCTTYMKDELEEKVRLSNYLFHALSRQELYLYYQPQVNIHTGQIIGFEALIRWHHPELGNVSPELFIPLAERTGLINMIGEWVIKTACKQNKIWHDLGLIYVPISVNISVIQFRNPKFVSQIQNILIENDLEPKYLEIEVTESIAINEDESIINCLSRLKEMGVSIAINGFGSAYEPLFRLKRLPINRIKIDRKFIEGIEKSDIDKAVVKNIINLAKNLDLKVTAEGVENEMQLDFLKTNKCDDMQGYYCYKPMNSTEIEKNVDYKTDNK